MSERYRFVWGEDILSLPKDNLLKALPDAGESELRTLICLASEHSFRSEEGFSRLCEILDCTSSSLRRDLAFWENAGVICLTDDADDAAADGWRQTSDGSLPSVRPIAAGQAASPAGHTEGTSAQRSAAQSGQTGQTAQSGQTVMSEQSQPIQNTPSEQSGQSQPLQRTAVEKRPHFLQSRVLPEYSEKDCAEIIAESDNLASVIDACQQCTGKMFRPADISVIVGMYDHAGLESEYIVTLCAWYAQNVKERFSMRGLEKMSIDLFDAGIDTVDALNEYIRKRDMRKDGIVKLRGMLSIGDRDLTPKEEETFRRWFEEWGFSMEIISRAWEVTVDQTGNAPLAYINKVLQNWYTSNLRTLEQVDAVLDTYKKNKTDAAKAKEDAAQKPAAVNGAESGFDTQKAFEAALQRSYRLMLEEEEEEKKKKES